MLKAELETGLLKYLTFWIEHALDHRYGGYAASCKDGDETCLAWEAAKRDVSTGRMLFAFAEAARCLPEVIGDQDVEEITEKCREAADLGYRFVRDCFLDKEFGWFYTAVDREGHVLDDSKTSYGGSFLYLGLIAYYQLTEDQECLNLLKELFSTLEEKMTDREGKGYFAHFTRDFDITPGKNMGAWDEKLLTSHQHLLETLSRLYSVWQDQQVKKRGEEIAELLKTVFLFPEMNGYTQRTDRTFRSLTDENVLGDLIENIWLFPSSVRAFGNEALYQEMKKKADQLYIYVKQKAVDPVYGGCFDRIRDDELCSDKVWWNLAELMNLEMERDPKGMVFRKTWDFIRDRMLHENGIWEWSTDQTGDVKKRIGEAVPISDGYHIVRMYLNVLKHMG